ncbi:unnamed protein product [Rodentolepis nana]|uniref:DAGKc domain-containing protein n=1 Tax=Rodentolepis nana TaxID=102285 RepID=A0A158QIT4_RODNA|nr:unnamed protein product [Rodentolepis nana]
MIKGLIKSIKKYPKTSIFLAGTFTYIGNHYQTKYNDNLLRRRLCSQLKELGMKPLKEKQGLHRVTVFLNPFAHQRGILEKFDDNAMPLLQISGLDVQMVYLDDDDEVKKLTNVLDPKSTDAIIVAGDDNLLAKAITGLLRRADYTNTNLWEIPVYALPLGIFNNFCTSVLKENNIINWCYRMIEPGLQQKCDRRNVLSIRPVIQCNEDGLCFQADQRKQETFAMTGIEWSCWRDVEYGGGGTSLTSARPASHKPRLVSLIDSQTTSDLSAFSYYTPRQLFKRLGARIRHGWNYIRSPEFDPSPAPEHVIEAARKKKKPIRRGCAKQANLFVKPVCPGCKKCWEKKCRVSIATFSCLFLYMQLAEYKPAKPRQSSWLSYFFGFAYSKNNDKTTPRTQPPEHENPECGAEIQLSVPLASRIVLTLSGALLCWLATRWAAVLAAVNFPPARIVVEGETEKVDAISHLLDYIHVNVSPAAKGLVDYIKQAMVHLTSPAYHCDNDLTPIPDPATLNSNEMSFLCSSVILCPSRTDVSSF